ncbi:monocarboxylate transporter 12-B-like [Cololabis saira]|uniref:monocarboxylate transporter 12-B-like n=1 Tax=Cololabis saira TaxID=129043 RepID=UPI002AD2CA99|nr:monocarboxylate transporter 12-B-like [Cololabis saira]
MPAGMAVTKEEKLESGRKESEVASPPEGGWGWMIVAGCFIATICIRAVTRCISMFFVEFQMHFEKDYSTTAWIHSLVDCTTMLCAPLGSFLGARLSCRATVILGGLLSSAGLVLSSFASSLEFLYISLGVITGLGFALSYTPAIAMVGRYFVERKALAYGIALSGSGIGTFILAPAVQLLIEHYSWRGALLILGGFVSNLCVCGALMRPLEHNTVKRTRANNLEDVTTHVGSKVNGQITFGYRHDEPKQQKIHILTETQRLLTAKGTFHNLGADNDKLQANLNLLPNPRQHDARSTDQKMANCILLCNKLTETVLGENEGSSLKLSVSSTSENLKAMESMTSNTSIVVDTKKEDSGLIEAKPADHLDKTVLAKVLGNAQRSFRDYSVCLKYREELGFLTIPNFLTLSVSFLFLAYACSAPVVYLVPYALSVGVEQQHAAFLMSIFGVCGILGNITFGLITDMKCLKRYRMLGYMLAIGLEGLCCMFVPSLHSFSLLVPFSALYGYFDGAYVALIPVVTSDTVGSTHLTSALGFVYFLHAIPYLVSPPIGGWLVDCTGNYTATFFLSATSYIISCSIVASIFLLKHAINICGRVQAKEHCSRITSQSKLASFFNKEPN